MAVTPAPAAPGSRAPRPGKDVSLRGLLLALVLLGAFGLVVELFLLEHTESPVQWAPSATLAGVLASGALVAVRPGHAAVRAFQTVMATAVLVGALGVYLHLEGNLEFEREADPSVHGFQLLWRSVRGATPTLAPGAMIQLGLLGLIFAYRHPVLSRPPSRASEG